VSGAGRLVESPGAPWPEAPLALLAHELRTPLGALIGYAEAMRGQVFGPLPAPYDAQAAVILEAARHLLALVDDMTDISAAEAGMWSGRRERFDAGALARGALALFAPRAAAAGVRTAADIDAAPLEVVADRRALGQILANLWDNALKFAAPDGEAIMTVRREGAVLFLAVTDSGPGDGAASAAGRDLAGRSLGRSRGQGGLGLRLVEALCAAHGGVLSLDRPKAGGFAATVRLPILAGP
jgi:cell cycle sensor histidine kinase DivJ